MPTRLSERGAVSAYGGTGPKNRSRRNLRTDAGRVAASQQSQQKRKISVKTKRPSPTAAKKWDGGRGATGGAGRSAAGAAGAAGGGDPAQSPAVRAEVLRLRKEIATRSEEVDDAARVLKKTKAQLKALAGKRRVLKGDKAELAQLASQIKALGARILDLSEEHRGLTSVKHSQQFAIRRLKDDARDYVERYESLKEEQRELKRQSKEERQRRHERASVYARAAKEEDELRRQVAVLQAQLTKDASAANGGDRGGDSPQQGGGDSSSTALQKYQGTRGSPSNNNNAAGGGKKGSPTRAEKQAAEREKRVRTLDRRVEILEHEIMKDQKRQASKLRKKRGEYDDLEVQEEAVGAQIASLQQQLAQANQLGRTLITQIKSFKILGEHPEETDLFKKKQSSAYGAAGDDGGGGRGSGGGRGRERGSKNAARGGNNHSNNKGNRGAGGGAAEMTLQGRTGRHGQPAGPRPVYNGHQPRRGGAAGARV